MSARVMSLWMWLGTVTLSAAVVSVVGCGDDENNGDAGADAGQDGGGEGDGGQKPGKDAGEDAGKEPGKDGGEEDSGEKPGADAGEDAGEDGGDEVISEGLDCNDPDKCVCGDNDACEGFMLVSEHIRPCCLMKEDEVICGLNADDVKKVDADSAFEGCVEYEAPGVPSEAAGDFFDRTGADDKAELDAENFQKKGDEVVCDVSVEETDDRQFTLYSEVLGGIPYAGCCTPDGQFGVDLTMSTDAQLSSAAAHFGCKSFEELQASLASDGEEAAPCRAEKEAIDVREADPETARNAEVLPFCNPKTGEVGCPPVLHVTLCEELKNQKVPISCEGGEKMPSWVCAATGLPTTEAQQADLEDFEYCMEMVPAYVRGCGDQDPEDCYIGIPGPPGNIFGCDQPEEGNTVPGVSTNICGCGVRMFPTDPKKPCISNVIKKACGAGLEVASTE